jgi:hypothetical protein
MNKSKKDFITVLRGINRILHFNLKWDFKRLDWRK